MESNCCNCQIKLLDYEINEDKPLKSICRSCKIKKIRTKIAIHASSLCCLRIKLRKLLQIRLDWSDSESESDTYDDDSDVSYTKFSGETLKGCKAYDSDESTIDED